LMGSEILIALVVVPVTMAVPVSIVYLIMKYARQRREMESRERLAAIEKGVDLPPALPHLRRGGSPLAGALILMSAGVGVALALWNIAFQTGAPIPWAVGAIPGMIGVGMLVHWVLGGREEWQKQRELDEELKRAYIDRLRGGGRAGKPEAGIAD
jgi:hypothetical protein